MDSSELDRYTRHRVQIVAGEIVDNLESILYDINSGKKVLVVCNTVSRCQEIFKALNKETESAILHGRFILRDRERIEKNLDNLKLLVGTQAIEVSLNIDYDVLYTEPAPIDALLQRFGRVNRRVHKGGVKTICPVHIFDKGSDKDSFIYSHDIVNDTLKVLRGINILKESLIQKLVDSVYKDGYTGKQLDEFISTTESFKSFYQTIIPFVNNEDVEEKFYSLFDNYTVVPIRFISEYTEEIKHGRYFEAMGYTLGISRGQFNKLNNDNRIYKEGTMYFINCEYDDIG
jgi:CRISPR-associated endonuclease/helicase Cas3